MSAQFVRFDFALLKGCDLKPTEHSILLAIQSYMPAPYPSIRKLQEICHISRNTVLKYLKSLENKNILLRVKRNGTSNLYMISKRFLTGAVTAKMRSAIKAMNEFWQAKLESNKRKKTSTKICTPPVPKFGTQSRREYPDIINGEQMFDKIRGLATQWMRPMVM